MKKIKTKEDFKKFRLSKKMTQKKFAEKTGLSIFSVQKKEQGKRPIMPIDLHIINSIKKW